MAQFAALRPFFVAAGLSAALSLGALGAACSTDPEASTPEPPEEDGGRRSPPEAGTRPEEDAGDAAIPDVPPPASLVTALSVKPYVEDVCEPTTYPGWPYEALKCTYRNNTLTVTVADPPPDRVARWIVDASAQIPALDGLKTTDPSGWEEGLIVIAKHTLGQSSRIFPLAGQVYENGTAYKFERGVTSTCKSGCYCRINSTSRYQWCKYAADVLGKNEQDCLVESGQTTSTLTEPWLAHCLENHIASWTSPRNVHYVAQAYNANFDVKTELAKTTEGGAPTTAQVIAALKKAYP